MTVRRWLVVAGTVAALTAGCSEVTRGTPVAGPDATARTTPPTTSPSPTTRARVPDPTTRAPRPPGSPPAALADTTCGEYVAMDPATQREVIEAIGAENSLVAMNPELWITLASAVCTFAAPATPVKDAVVGGGFR
ncbi:hypothetical protein [Mycobacterium sp. GA-2829]|uniref:hypothetical protein n=1 Tax=Mycobacterium sp. GA-2829 TaxID=1772283 RepID=UPI000ACC0B94|nr:hypothetical protein [Mycobacterium sp. GA-2829]